MKQISRKKGLVSTIKKSLVKDVEELSDDQVKYDTYADNGEACQLSMKEQLQSQMEHHNSQEQGQYNTVELESQEFMPKSNIDTFYDSEIMNEIEREIYAEQGSFVQDQPVQSNLKKTRENPSKSTHHEDSNDLTSTDIEKQQKGNKNKSLQNSRLKKEELKKLQENRILQQKARILQEKQRAFEEKVRLMQQKEQKKKESQQKARLLQQKAKAKALQQKKKAPQKKPPTPKPPAPSSQSSQSPLQIPQKRTHPTTQPPSTPLKKTKPNHQPIKINLNPTIKIKLLRNALNVSRILREVGDGFEGEVQGGRMVRLAREEVMWFYKDQLVDYFRGREGKCSSEVKGPE